jgi:hypothetical protein
MRLRWTSHFVLAYDKAPKEIRAAFDKTGDGETGDGRDVPPGPLFPRTEQTFFNDQFTK